MDGAKTWADVFKDPAMIITLIVTFQFFFLIILFSMRPSQMAMEAKGIILQTYVVAFTACWSYFLRGVIDKDLLGKVTVGRGGGVETADGNQV